MFQRSQHSFIFKLLVLKCVLTTSLAVRIAVDGSALTCVISESECSSVTIYCEGEEVEWLNPNNVVINYTTTERIYTIDYTGLMKIEDPQVTDSGRYTCRAKANHSDIDEVMVIVKQRPTFAFGSGFIYEEKTALLFTDVFLNCSVDPIDTHTSWEFKNRHIINNQKYSQNISGLTIHNVTEEDQGQYICFLGHFDPTSATVLLKVVWPPKLYLPQNRTMEVNVNEEVILNCTVSASPDPVYTWSFPDSCSSCPDTSNDSVLIFTPEDITDSGEYTCVAENDYGTVTKQITIRVLLHIEVEGSALTCVISESDCSSVTINCQAEEEVEWLNPNNVVINFTTTERIYTIAYTGLMMIENPQVADSGRYTCRVKANHSENDEITLTVKQRPTFASGSGFIYEEKTALLFTDVFINCSVDPMSVYTSWEFKNKRIINNQKYSQNISGLTIHNVTVEDQGYYICFIGHFDPPNATILLSVVWPPKLFLPQSRTMEVNISEEVILNCSASSSPDLSYTWSTPDSCSSCPKFNNDSIMIFTADITKSGDYICVAENEYGTGTKQITINVLSKPLIATESVKIIMEERNNLVLSCDVQYAYPLPTIEWSILNPLSNEYTLIQENTTNYQLHRNGSIELLHRFLFEMGYIIVICSATNVYGSNTSTFYLWEHETFMRRQEFKIYLDNITNCKDLEKDKDLFTKMIDSLREWFDSACRDYCNGHNNLYTPQLTCLDRNMGIVSSVVHHEGENSAQMLIDLAIADVQARNPPVVHLSHGWLLRLNQTLPEQIQSSSSQPLVIGVSVGVAVTAVILLLIVVGTVFGIHKRYLKTKIDSKDNEQTEAHIYDEVGNYAKTSTVCKSQSILYNGKDDNVIFEVSTSQTPAYQPIVKSFDDSYKTRNENFNDYYIDGKDNSKVENIYKEEKCLTDDREKELQNDHPYNKLMHLKQ